MMRRRAVKQPGALMIAVIVLAIYLFVFAYDLKNADILVPRVFLPAIVGGIGGFITGLFTSVKREMFAMTAFFGALIMTGIYQGLTGTSRLTVAIASLILQFASVVSYSSMHIQKRDRKKRRK